MSLHMVLEAFDVVFEELGVALVILLDNIIWLIAGVLIGMSLGTIPGMGGVVVLTILLPFTLGMNPNQAFTLLSGAVGATTFSGSITAILINTPGTSSNAATLIDGYPMTQNGKSNTGLTISSVSSASGAVLTGILFILSIPILMEVTLLFGPSEIFWLVLIAIVIIPLILSNNPVWGVMTAFLGASLAFIGTSPQTAEPRFTFGMLELHEGIDLLPVLVGVFAVAEIFRLSSLNRNTVINFDSFKTEGSRIEGVKAFLRHKWLFLRTSFIGAIVGAIPGAGGSTAAFVAYGHAAQSTPEKEEFGSGAVEGVIAPESANDAKDLGQLIPTLGLGIPGSGSMAVFLAGLLMHGLVPSPRLVHEELHLVLLIAFALMASNILTSVIGLAGVKQFSRVLEVPIPRLGATILALALSAIFISRNFTIDLWLTLAFGLLGALFIYLGVNRVPFVVAFILAAIVETQYHYAVSYAGGDILEAFFTGQLNLILIAIGIISIVGIMFDKKIQSIIQNVKE